MAGRVRDGDRDPRAAPAADDRRVVVERYDEAKAALERARDYLVADPVAHSVLLSLLHERVADPMPGRYWVLVGADSGTVLGFVFQSPLDFPAVSSPMTRQLVDVAVAAIVEDGVSLPGVSGLADTAASFAGAWTEATRGAARPASGQRIYVLETLAAAPAPAGVLRPATTDDAQTVLPWMAAFVAELGEPELPVDISRRRLEAGHYVLWDDGGPMAMAAASSPQADMVRIYGVFTPPQLRGRGYAGACVGALCAQVQAAGHGCMLYADLANPTSNALYRRLGFEARHEVLRYEFDAAPPRRAAEPR